ncbi:FkbM family methyltransferase [Phenylobacterium immobile]|uniref:FkbM family methyltransferase n=1 Tax=Phenylobacterium immobile TaxID=21 RepID=UPI000AE40173|nr:FkbM family methyltransferase [Phenylobacterium immobile]
MDLQDVEVASARFRTCASAERRPYWDRVNAGDWEPQTFRIFHRFLDRSRACVDIGAWIGPTTLYAANFCPVVHAIEPDPVARAELAANLAANPGLAAKVSVHAVCIAPEPGVLRLFAGGMYFDANSRFGDSMSGITPAGDGVDQPSREASGVRLEDFLAGLEGEPAGFIKMDVEGGEYDLIPGRWRRLAEFGAPTACISFHAPAPARRAALIGACLEELAGCYPYLYAADGRRFDAAQAVAAVADWTDDDPASDFRALDRLLGDGLVCAHQAW